MYWLTNPYTLTVIALFIGNFIIARLFTLSLVRNGYMTYGSPQFERSMFFWFVPIMGALGLFMVRMTYASIEFYRWLFLNHHKPVEVKPKKPKAPRVKKALTDEDILQRASEINFKKAQQKIKENREKFAAKKRKK